MQNNIKAKKRFNFGWKSRHLLVLVIAVIGTYLLLESRAQWSDMHKWNRAVGDTSLILVAFSMVIGPLSRLIRKTTKLLPWRREFGIYGVLLAFAHTIISLIGWVELDLMRLFGFEFHPQLQQYVMLKHGFGLANVLGLAALLFASVLALTSNNLSERLLGASVWKYVQQSTYVFWWLIVLHTGYFLFMHFLYFHKQLPDPNWARWPFVWLVASVTTLQFLASLRTWRIKRRGAPLTT
ncbi:MAG: ferric reductase-like transmembrane domain-containing protein [Robiginitomaculum sp.]|nr:ferric reductase-like transmembrane domain-containing protein [Robiginitomaculum sp.]